jgi:hypothetical protein
MVLLSADKDSEVRRAGYPRASQEPYHACMHIVLRYSYTHLLY